MKFIRIKELFSAFFFISFLITTYYIGQKETPQKTTSRQNKPVNVFMDVGTNNADSAYQFFGLKSKKVRQTKIN